MRGTWPVRTYTYALILALAVSLVAAIVLLELGYGRAAFVLLVGAVIVALITSLALARWIAEPIGRISAVAARVAAGDLKVRAEPQGPLEVAEIARQMNRMLDELALAERELRRSEVRYRALYETSNDAIVCVDLDGRIVFANDATQRMLGYAPPELIGRDVALLQPVQFRERYRRGLREFVAGGPASKRTTVETLALHRDGREIAVEFTYSHLRAGDESLIVGILRDITERRTAMARLRESEAALRQLNATLEDRVQERTRLVEAANRELEAFSYSVSHDLRAPLRAISGFTDLVLERAGDLDAESKSYLGRVKSAAARMGELINDLIDLSRVARAVCNRRETCLSTMASEIVAELAETEPQRKVDVRIAEHVNAYADPGLARVLLANLIGNAWKFTGRRENATIEFGTERLDDLDAFFVRDNGAGFDVAHADKLFAPFQRLHSEREFPGTGIGLALAHRVVHRHGGRMWAQAAVDSGATFFFTLPSR
jgi:PAS domain S-box-containing protein